MRKRVFAVACCAAALVLVPSTAAFAGEITGPPGPDGFATGKPTPIATGTANSVCAFSGLNAFHPGKEGVYAGHVQNYGALVSQGQKAENPSPGDLCNGHTGELAAP